MKPSGFYHKIISIIFTGIVFLNFSYANVQSDSLAIKQLEEHPQQDSGFNKNKFWFITGLHTAGYAGSLYLLSNVWYNNFDQTKFHSFDDINEWGGMDKLGHITTAWQLANFSYTLYRYTGIKNNKAAFIGSAVSFLYQSTLEIFDGFSADWGFSFGDMGANLIGSSFAYFRNTGRLKNFHYKFSWMNSKYAAYRPDVLGTTFPEQLLKDYNGQNYWLSVNMPKKWFTNESRNWLCFSLGYSIDGFTGGKKNYVDPGIINQPVFSRVGEFYLSLDIDFTKFNIKNKVLRNFLKIFNVVKIPFPAIGLTTSGNVLIRAIYF